jgi:hypothetical protein
LPMKPKVLLIVTTIALVFFLFSACTGQADCDEDHPCPEGERCVDGKCHSTETPAPNECDEDGTCEPSEGETVANCPNDCECDANNPCPEGETCDENYKCIPGEAPVCDNDGVCDEGEIHENCPKDCPCDNDGTCEPVQGETVANCPNDCECDANNPCPTGKRCDNYKCVTPSVTIEDVICHKESGEGDDESWTIRGTFSNTGNPEKCEVALFMKRRGGGDNQDCIIESEDTRDLDFESNKISKCLYGKSSGDKAPLILPTDESYEFKGLPEAEAWESLPASANPCVRYWLIYRCYFDGVHYDDSSLALPCKTKNYLCAGQAGPCEACPADEFGLALFRFADDIFLRDIYGTWQETLYTAGRSEWTFYEDGFSESEPIDATYMKSWFNYLYTIEAPLGRYLVNEKLRAVESSGMSTNPTLVFEGSVNCEKVDVKFVRDSENFVVATATCGTKQIFIGSDAPLCTGEDPCTADEFSFAVLKAADEIFKQDAYGTWQGDFYIKTDDLTTEPVVNPEYMNNVLQNNKEELEKVEQVFDEAEPGNIADVLVFQGGGDGMSGCGKVSLRFERNTGTQGDINWDFYVVASVEGTGTMEWCAE